MAIYSMYVYPIAHSRPRINSSVKSVAYVLRADLTDERRGRRHNFTNYKAEDQYVVASGTVLPLDAPPEWSDPQVLWNAAEFFNDTKTGRPARGKRITLPKEFNDEQLISLCEALVVNEQSEGRCVTWALHKSKTWNEESWYQPHLHIIETTNPCNSQGFTAKGKTGYVVRDLATGGDTLLTAAALNAHSDRYAKLYKFMNNDGEKEWMTDAEALASDEDWTRVDKYPKKKKITETDWDDVEALKRWRKDAETTINDHLRWNGFDIQVSCESYATRGIDKEPLIYESPRIRKHERKHAEKLRMQGRAYTPDSDVAKHNYGVRRRNKQRERERLRKSTVKQDEQRMKEAENVKKQRQQRRQQQEQQQLNNKVAKELEKKIKRELVDSSRENDDIGVEAVFAE